MAEAKPRDPITQRSLLPHFLVISLITVIFMVWAVWDEAYARRPWKGYQAEFTDRLAGKLEADLAAARGALSGNAGYDAARQALAEVERVFSAPVDGGRSPAQEIEALRTTLADLEVDLKRRQDRFAVLRGEYQALIYKYEKARYDADPGAAAGYQREYREIETQIAALDVDSLKQRKEQILRTIENLRAPVEEARRNVASFEDRITELEAQVAANTDFDVAIRQIHVESGESKVNKAGWELVDRCESCHLGTSLQGLESWEHPFKTHPRPELLATHPPERFGCSPCHNGNGIATDTLQHAHGLEKHWKKPLYPADHAEAGCVQCHTADLVLDHGPTVTHGKELFLTRGCYGCHRYEGFDTEREEAAHVRKEIDLATGAIRDLDRRIAEAGATADSDATAAADAVRLRDVARNLTVDRSREETRRADLERRLAALALETKRIGPTLRNAVSKLRREWIPYWLEDPRRFRPTTKMPNFWPVSDYSPEEHARITGIRDEEVRAISAYLWATGGGGDRNAPFAPPEAPPDKVDTGRRLFKERGCLGCHSMTFRIERKDDRPTALGLEIELDLSGPAAAFRSGMDLEDGAGNRGRVESVSGSKIVATMRYGRFAPGASVTGTLADATATATVASLREAGSFATDLTDVGRKARFEYIARWIMNPRGVDPQTVMPDFRLTPAEANAIATFVMANAADVHAGEPLVLPDAPFMNVGPLPERPEEPVRGRDESDETWRSRRSAYDRDLARHQTEREAYFAASDTQKAVARGEELVRFYGCFGCHDMRGHENEGRIGKELTNEGSTPLDRVDFGWREEEFDNHWDRKNVKGQLGGYTLISFIRNKLRTPRTWDILKEKKPHERLRMPNFGLTEDEVRALTTFVTGSVDVEIPDQFRAIPEGPKKDIADGWWVVRKYNCAGCHAFEPGETPKLWKLPWFEGDNLPRRPPILHGEGARVNLDWLTRFLANPALDPADIHRNGVRAYLAVRMPTFHLSEDENRKLVKFFAALANQPYPYIAPAVAPLTADELTVAREIFRHGKCMSCHVGNVAEITEKTVAPSFGLVKSRLNPDWVRRWVIAPQAFDPSTSMVGLFEFDGKRWIIKDMPDAVKSYPGDHVELFLRYQDQFTDAELPFLK